MGLRTDLVLFPSKQSNSKEKKQKKIGIRFGEEILNSGHRSSMEFVIYDEYSFVNRDSIIFLVSPFFPYLCRKTGKIYILYCMSAQVQYMCVEFVFCRFQKSAHIANLFLP